MWGVVAAHFAAFWPIYAIVGAIALVTAGVVLLIKNWQKVLDFFRGIGDAVKNAVGKVGEFFGFSSTTSPVVSTTAEPTTAATTTAEPTTTFAPTTAATATLVPTTAAPTTTLAPPTTTAATTTFVPTTAATTTLMPTTAAEPTTSAPTTAAPTTTLVPKTTAPATQGKPFGDIPTYSLGTDYVPEPGLRIVHKGEKIIPAELNKQGQRICGAFTQGNTSCQNVYHIVNHIKMNCEDLTGMESFIQMLKINGGLPA